MPTRVREIATDEEWDEAVAVLTQLWDHVEEDFVRSWIDEAEYRPFGLYEIADPSAGATTATDAAGATLVAVAGVSIQRVLHHERHLWVHDFVVDEPRRGEGFGRELLDWLDDWAGERDCEVLALACWVENDDAREFYEHEGLETWGYLMEREL